MKKIINELRSISCSSDELSINFESSPDAAVLIGTKQAYINVALKLLEVANQSERSTIETDIIDGMSIKYSNDVKNAFNELGGAWPVALRSLGRAKARPF